MQKYKKYLNCPNLFRKYLSILMSALERIKEFIDSKGISVKKFEESVGFSNGSFASQLKKHKTIGVDKLENILRIYPELNPTWVLRGIGNMLIQTPYDRINYILEKKGITEREFEKGTNAGNYIIAGAYNRAKKNPGDISVAEGWVESVLKIAPEYSKSWLLYGLEPQMVQPESHPNSIINFMGKHRIPLIPTDAFAGPGLPSFDDLPIEEYYDISDFYDADFIIRVKGASMQPNYCSGDLVACRIVQETLFFQWGKIYVINTRSQGVMIKRIKRSSLEGHILLVSDNEDYDPFDVPVSDIDALAIVLGGIKLE